MMRPDDDRRYLCSEIVSVLYEDRAHEIRQTHANLEEISSRSAMLLCDEPLEPALPVAFRSQGHDLYGTVASATYDRLLGWYIELRLDASSCWTPQWFVPDHHLCVRAAVNVEAGELVRQPCF